MHYQLRRRRRHSDSIPGPAHALTFCCFHRFQFLSKERTCGWLAEALQEARRELDFALWAYVFMPEHVHLLLWPRQRVHDIAAIRHRIKEPVGRKAIEYLSHESPHWLDRITRRRGARSERLFWQSGGGFDANIDAPFILWSEIEYMHLNPVRRKLVAQARDWKWSSAGWFEGCPLNELRPDPIPPEWFP